MQTKAQKMVDTAADHPGCRTIGFFYLTGYMKISAGDDEIVHSAR
jgi:hypothetical protein